MTLARDEIEKGFAEEMAAFSGLVRSLTDAERATPSRCEGWTVGDVAAHVSGTLAAVVSGDFEGLGTPEVTQRHVDDRRGRTGTELADELDAAVVGAQQLLASFDDAAWHGPAPAGVASSIAVGVEGLWYDAFVHTDDIRAALGRPPVVGDGIRAAVTHLANLLSDRGWGPATVALDGLEPVAISGGGGRTVTGDPLQFVLVSTGRADPATLGLDDTVNVYR